MITKTQEDTRDGIKDSNNLSSIQSSGLEFDSGRNYNKLEKKKNSLRNNHKKNFPRWMRGKYQDFKASNYKRNKNNNSKDSKSHKNRYSNQKEELESSSNYFYKMNHNNSSNYDNFESSNDRIRLEKKKKKKGKKIGKHNISVHEKGGFKSSRAANFGFSRTANSSMQILAHKSMDLMKKNNVKNRLNHASHILG